eukprot:scaffold1704_cov246-Pinguiococcus_pyrenoidosus.AAC.5
MSIQCARKRYAHTLLFLDADRERPRQTSSPSARRPSLPLAHPSSSPQASVDRRRRGAIAWFSRGADSAPRPSTIGTPGRHSHPARAKAFRCSHPCCLFRGSPALSGETEMPAERVCAFRLA